MTKQITKPEQKLVSFTETSKEFEDVKNDIKNGWKIVSLIKNGVYFAGIMERMTNQTNDSVYLPPRKKIKISSFGSV